MGFTHCYGISPFQGFFGRWLAVQWASPIAMVFRPCRAFAVDGWRFNGLHPLLWYFALSGLLRSMVRGVFRGVALASSQQLGLWTENRTKDNFVRFVFLVEKC